MEHNMVLMHRTSSSTWCSRKYNHWNREEAVMPEPPYRALRILLRMFSPLAALGGLLMIFAGAPHRADLSAATRRRSVHTAPVASQGKWAAWNSCSACSWGSLHAIQYGMWQ